MLMPYIIVSFLRSVMKRRKFRHKTYGLCLAFVETFIIFFKYCLAYCRGNSEWPWCCLGFRGYVMCHAAFPLPTPFFSSACAAVKTLTLRLLLHLGFS